MKTDPLPYLVVSNVFPPDFYAALVRAIPPFELFADRPHNKRQLTVPFTYGPVYCRAIWKFLVDVVLGKRGELERFAGEVGVEVGQRRLQANVGRRRNAGDRRDRGRADQGN